MTLTQTTDFNSVWNRFSCATPLDDKENFDVVADYNAARNGLRSHFGVDVLTMLCSEWTLAKVAHTAAFKLRYRVFNGDLPDDATPEFLARALDNMLGCRVGLSDNIPINEFHLLPNDVVPFNEFVMAA